VTIAYTDNIWQSLEVLCTLYTFASILHLTKRQKGYQHVIIEILRYLASPLEQSAGMRHLSEYTANFQETFKTHLCNLSYL